MARVHERALFDLDIAADVRGDFREAIEDGLSADEATARVVAGYRDMLDDEDEGPVVRLALAVAQSQLGRLDDETKEAALAVIRDGASLARWEEAGAQAAAAARRMYEGIGKQLSGPQPKPGKPRVSYTPTTTLVPGQVLAHRHADGGYTLARVSRIESSRYGDTPVLVVLRWHKDRLPPAWRLSRLDDEPDLPFDGPWRPRDTSVFGVTKHKRHDPDHSDVGLAVVGDVPVRPDRFHCNSYVGWKGFVRHLEQRHDPVGWWQSNKPDEPVPAHWRDRS